MCSAATAANWSLLSDDGVTAIYLDKESVVSRGGDGRTAWTKYVTKGGGGTWSTVLFYDEYRCRTREFRISWARYYAAEDLKKLVHEENAVSEFTPIVPDSAVEPALVAVCGK